MGISQVEGEEKDVLADGGTLGRSVRRSNGKGSEPRWRLNDCLLIGGDFVFVMNTMRSREGFCVFGVPLNTVYTQRSREPAQESQKNK